MIIRKTFSRLMRQGDCAGCRDWRLCRGNSFHLFDPESSRTRLCYCRLHRLTA